jgi:hypothetical protein
MHNYKIRQGRSKPNIVKELAKSLDDNTDLAVKIFSAVKDLHSKKQGALTLGFVNYPTPVLVVVREHGM